ncbi:hypothetical protein L873DRAFT_1803039 [Choiromyces venosus 120613-1]|uniref:Uncharacterized protein n=1 Tax=Choiromyces venosus 120613-1 TaxID=1336337 RepID=A0A3N4JY77_9PEZI|nr:hypothetical protein L873DRAFT_1803039 [Choiromyces venosus 120613-1]
MQFVSAGNGRWIPVLEIISAYGKNSNNWTVCYVVGLSSRSKVKKFLFFLFCLGGGKGAVFLAVFFAPFREKGIFDYIAHCPIIRVFTVVLDVVG